MRRWIALLGLLMVLPLTGQEEDGGKYFALTSNRTFAPGEKASVMLYANGLRQLDFRLYRVEKAGEFLGQLVNAHSFGNETAELPKKETLLGKFVRLKRKLKVDMIQLARRQFTPEALAEYRLRKGDKPAAPTQPGAKGTAYAAIPVLNDKQLVRTWKETISTKNRWDEQAVEVPVTEPGLYLVEVTDGKLRAYTLLSMSAMAVLTKAEQGKAHVRVVDRISGKPLGGVPVEFRSHKKLHATIPTDANGFAQMTGEDSSDVFVVATQNRDVAFDAIGEYTFGANPHRQSIVYSYTDRPVYRPGHKVYFKSIFRQKAAFGYELPKFGEVLAEVTDGEGKSIYKKELSLSKFGSVHGELELPMTAALGYYSLKLSQGELESYASFQVEEYKKPEYEVKIRPSKERVLQGDRVEATIEGRYYFGEPVKGAKVTYTVRRARYYPPWFDREEMGFEQTEEDESGGEFFSGEQGEEKVGKLDDKGQLTVDLPTPVVEGDYLFRIEAKVMDEGNREVTGYGMVVATHGSYMVQVSSSRYVVTPDSPHSYTVQLKDYDSKPITGDFRAELVRWTWGNGTSRTEVVQTQGGRTGADGKSIVTFAGVPSGSYRVVVRSRTPEGRDVTDTDYVWVSGAGFGGSNDASIKLIPDKKRYAPGDVAKVLILTTDPDAYLWVTTESRTVIDSKALYAAKAGGVTVEVPIRSEYQPRVFLDVSYLKAGVYHHGSVALQVPAVERQLDIKLMPTKREFKPGEPASYNVEVKDLKGQPVKAELSIGIVDEALYAVQRDMTQTPLSYFYGYSYNEVQSSTSLSYYFRGEAGKRAMRLARIRPSLGQLKPENVGDPRVRKAFPDTAFWTANLETDANGKAKVDLTFPDALTMWRATARAVSADTKVGASLDRVIVRKNLLIRMVTPRFLMEGDEVTLGVIVQNYLATAKDAKVSISATGVDWIGPTEQTLRVDSKGIAKAEFRARVRPGSESVITAKAITNEESDAVELKLPMYSYGTLFSSGRGGSLTDGKSAAVVLDAQGTGNRKLEVRVSPSLAGSMFGALEYLTQFPYGCTEQTMSSFLPNVIVSEALDALKLKSNVRREDLRAKVQAGLERLYDYQHGDGAWGWWKDDASHPFMTAHVISGLKQARRAGYGVSPEVLERGEEWLRQEFRRQKDARPDLRSYLAYALGTKAEVEQAWALRPQMTSYGLAFLGLALQELKDPRALEIAQSLEAAARQSDSEAWWPATRDPLLDFEDDATPENTAFVLKFLTATRPDSPLLPKAAQWLVLHKNQGAWWNSTKQTAMVIYGLTDFVRKTGELSPDISVSVTVNGKTLVDTKFGGGDATGMGEFTASAPALDRNQIEVKVNGKGRVYWNAQATYYTTAEDRQPSSGGSMSASREYFRLVPRENAGATSYALEPLSGDIKPGDSIAVLLTVKAADWKYVLIEDPIPAGMELVTNDNTINLTGKPLWWRYSWAQREFRDNRVGFFRTYWNHDDKQYFYVMKAVNPGKFRVPPTRIQPMYQPDQTGTGKASVIEVKP